MASWKRLLLLKGTQKPFLCQTHVSRIKRKKRTENNTLKCRRFNLVVFCLFQTFCIFHSEHAILLSSKNKVNFDIWEKNDTNTKTWVRDATRNKAGPSLRKYPHKFFLPNVLHMKVCTGLITAPGSAPYTLGSRQFLLSQSNLKQGRVSEGKAHTGWEAKERLTAFVTTYRPSGPVTKVILIHLSICGPER